MVHSVAILPLALAKFVLNIVNLAYIRISLNGHVYFKIKLTIGDGIRALFSPPTRAVIFKLFLCGVTGGSNSAFKARFGVELPTSYMSSRRHSIAANKQVRAFGTFFAQVFAM